MKVDWDTVTADLPPGAAAPKVRGMIERMARQPGAAGKVASLAAFATRRLPDADPDALDDELEAAARALVRLRSDDAVPLVVITAAALSPDACDPMCPCHAAHHHDPERTPHG